MLFLFCLNTQHVDPLHQCKTNILATWIDHDSWKHTRGPFHSQIWVFPKNMGKPPKSSILIGFSIIINHPFWGSLFLETPIWKCHGVVFFLVSVQGWLLQKLRTWNLGIKRFTHQIHSRELSGTKLHNIPYQPALLKMSFSFSQGGVTVLLVAWRVHFCWFRGISVLISRNHIVAGHQLCGRLRPRSRAIVCHRHVRYSTVYLVIRDQKKQLHKIPEV